MEDKSIFDEAGLDPKEWELVDSPPIIPAADLETALQYPAHRLPVGMLSIRAQAERPQAGIPVRALWPVQAPGKANSNSAIVSQVAPVSKAVANAPSANTQVVSVGSGGTMQKSSLGNAPKGKLPVAPISLTNLSDGTSRFARTSVHSSHAPTTNPLTAHDAGANVTINIASHTMQVGATAVSNNSGSVTALSYSTLYYIYYDDASLAGGAVSYQATTTKTTAINGAGRFFVGSILTPKATAPDTNGNGDGGTGSQIGGLSQLLCSVATPTVNSPGTVTNPGNAIDGDFTTFATLAITTSGLAQLKVGGIPGYRSGRALSLTLKILSGVTVVGTGYTVTLAYSTNGGGTFTTIYSVSASRVLTLDTVSLPVTTNPGAVQVVLSVSQLSGTNSANAKLYEAWIEIQE